MPLINRDTFSIPPAFTRLLGGLGNLRSLYIRPCYKELDRIVEESYQQRTVEKRHQQRTVEKRHIIITGTPGVEKSTFLLYELLQARPRKRDVVVQIGKRTFAFLSTQSTVLTGLTSVEIYTLLEESPDVMFMYNPASTKEGLQDVM